MSTFPTAIVRAGNELVIRLCSDKGDRKIFRTRFKPEIFVPSVVGTPPEVADALALRCEEDPRGKTPLNRVEFDNLWDFSNYIKENRDVPGVRLYGSDDPVVQCFANLFKDDIKHSAEHIRCFNLDIEVVSSYMKKGEFVKGPFPHPIIEDERYRTKKIDMEAYSQSITNFYTWWNTEFPDSCIPTWTNMHAAFPITSLQLSDLSINKKIIWGLPLRKDRGTFVYNPADDEIGGIEVEYREFTTEDSMLIDFIHYWAKRSPDAWTGWSIKNFDAPYLAERILKILGEDWLMSLSPIGRYRRYIAKPKGGVPFTSYTFEGVATLDYIELYKKHRMKMRAKYSLDFISYIELGDKKLSYTHVSSLNKLWFDDYNNMMRYGIKDILLVDRLEEKLGFLKLTYMLAALYKCNYEDTLGTVQAWNCLLFNYNYNTYDQKLVPMIRKVQEAEAYEGAYVHDPVVGLHKRLLSEDLNGLYPHIQQGWNMGPETKVTKFERGEIIYEMVHELEDFKCDFIRNRARLAFIDALQNNREIINEMVAFGKFEFVCLKERNVSMSPNLEFFINDKMSCYSAISRKMYATRKIAKTGMLSFEQYSVQIKELIKQRSEGSAC